VPGLGSPAKKDREPGKKDRGGKKTGNKRPANKIKMRRLNKNKEVRMGWRLYQ
jgi:hypothetical protein